MPEGTKPIDLDNGLEILGALVRRELEELTNPTKHLTGTQRQTQIQRCVTTLSAISKMTGEALDMPEKKIIRTPAFRRASEAILEALKDHPDALVKVVAALDGLGKPQGSIQ